MTTTKTTTAPPILLPPQQNDVILLAEEQPSTTTTIINPLSPPPQPAETTTHPEQPPHADDDININITTTSSTPTPLYTTHHPLTLITTLTLLTAIGNFLSGLLTILIPILSKSLSIPQPLQLWPQSSYALACGCTLLPCAALSDALGSGSKGGKRGRGKRTVLLGSLLQTITTLGTGLSESFGQLVAFRVMGGVAASLCLPGAVAVASGAFPEGDEGRDSGISGSDIGRRRRQWRNAAFAAMGGGQAVGFGLGLVVGGLCGAGGGDDDDDGVGGGAFGERWRWGFHVTAMLNGVVMGVAFWALPSSSPDPSQGRRRGREEEERQVTTTGLLSSVEELLGRLRKVDWVGSLIASFGLGLLSYVLAAATGSGSGSKFGSPVNIVLLVLGVMFLPGFWLWMRRQTRLGRPALIPNDMWSNLAFTSICAIVFFTWGALNASEQLLALYLQDVRHESALTSSLYFLPAPIAGIIMNLAVAVFLPYLRPSVAVSAGCLVSAAAPMLLAVLCRSDGPGYWRGVFHATALNPLGADLVYTIANLIVTGAFPAKTQALAGGVFNMVAQIGKSVGIATTATIAAQIESSSKKLDGVERLMQGYKIGWWYNTAFGLVSVVVAFWGLRGVKKLGVKQE